MTTVADKMASKSWAATRYKDTICSLHPPHQRSLISLSSTVQNLNRPDFLSKNSSGWKTGPVAAVGRIWCWRWQNSVMSEGFSAWGGQHWCLGREFLHNQGLFQHARLTSVQGWCLIISWFNNFFVSISYVHTFAIICVIRLKTCDSLKLSVSPYNWAPFLLDSPRDLEKDKVPLQPPPNSQITGLRTHNFVRVGLGERDCFGFHFISGTTAHLKLTFVLGARPQKRALCALSWEHEKLQMQGVRAGMKRSIKGENNT